MICKWFANPKLKRVCCVFAHANGGFSILNHDGYETAYDTQDEVVEALIKSGYVEVIPD